VRPYRATEGAYEVGIWQSRNHGQRMAPGITPGKIVARSPDPRRRALARGNQAENSRAKVLGKPCESLLPFRVVHKNVPVFPGRQRQRCVNRLKSDAKLGRCIVDRDGHRYVASVDA
jgi:hypothetical protein